MLDKQFSSEVAASYPYTLIVLRREAITNTMSAFIVGSTGLCGNLILKHGPEYFSKCYTLSRSKPDNSDNESTVILTSKDSSTWTELISKEPIDQPDTFFSGLGTTRAKAGGISNQRLIDYDLNLELAKAAKSKGFKKYVLVSSMGASASSPLPYPKMKGQLEDDVIALGFEQTIILRPGILLGERHEDKGLLNNLAVKLGSTVRGTFFAKYAGSPTEAEEVALAALKSSQKKYEDKVVILSPDDIINLAKE